MLRQRQETVSEERSVGRIVEPVVVGVEVPIGPLCPITGISVAGLDNARFFYAVAADVVGMEVAQHNDVDVIPTEPELRQMCCYRLTLRAALGEVPPAPSGCQPGCSFRPSE